MEVFWIVVFVAVFPLAMVIITELWDSRNTDVPDWVREEMGGWYDQ